RAELAKASEEAERCRAGLAQVEQYEKTAAKERSRHIGLLAELRNIDIDLIKADEDAGRVTALHAKRVLADSRRKLADAEYRRIADVIRRIGIANESKRKLAKIRPELTAAVDAARAGLEAAKENAAAALVRLNAAAAPDPQFDALCRMADEAAEFNAATAELDALRKKIGRIAELQQLRGGVDGEIAALNAPDRETWKSIQAAAGEQEKARVRLDALALRVVVTAEIGLEFEVEIGAPAGRVSVGPGGEVDLRSEGEVRFRMPGTAAFRISGPAGDAAVWRKRLASAGEQLAALTAAFRTDQPTELARRVETLGVLDSKRIRLEADLAALLNGAAPDVLASHAEELARRRRGLCGEFPEWEANPPDAAALKAAREARRSERDGAARVARQAWQTTEAQRSAAELAFSKATAALDRNRDDSEKAEAELALLMADGKPAEEREQDLMRRRRECESAESDLAEVERELALLPADAVERAAVLRRRCGELQEETGRAERAFGDAEAGARALLAHGPYEVLSGAEERVAELERRCAADQFRLDSIRILWETLDAAKARALAGLAEPVALAATEILTRIAGRAFAEVQLGEGLGPGAVLPGGGDGKCGIGELSGGEQEQVYLATRLALADVLTRDEPHTVVLDDVLLNTDDDRLGRILELIEERAARMNFLILTCHPERYSALSRATQITLENFEVRA
ncbi:MAG TPA: hypothetical protein VN428_16830, partial [Bryobacteraceae bacterium]|nr:hypothetical protein [Bryobacteraceae bacterium]